ncbi:MAG: hypothetical protein ACM3P1_07585 [Candidatus Saccharibacteria bacterium]
MRNTLTMLCILVASLTGYSQEKSFNLNHYKFPDYKRHELELNFSSWGYMNKETYNIFNSSGIMEQRDYKSSRNNSSLNFGYQYDNLTRKHIDFLTSTLSGDYQYTMSKDYSEKDVQSNPSLRWSINGFKKYYLTENKFFVEGLTDLDFSWNKSKRTLTNIPDEIHNQNYQSLSVGLGIGVGRIEKVSDLWQAYYILEKLNKQGSFNRPLEEQDVYEFAKLSSRLKNRRFFDVRLHKIEELKGLDSLLHQQGLIRESDISYFTTLNDYWNFGDFHERQSGVEFLVQASPNYRRASLKTGNDKAVVSQRSSIVSRAEFTYTKQLNLFWERSVGASVSYESLMDSTGNYFYDTPDDKYFTNAYLSYGYYPNSRTAIYGSISYQGDNIVILNTQNNTEDSWRNMASFHLSGNYYFSPQLQVAANVNFDYTDKNNSSLDKFNTYYNVVLRYAIF